MKLNSSMCKRNNPYKSIKDRTHNPTLLQGQEANATACKGHRSLTAGLLGGNR